MESGSYWQWSLLVLLLCLSSFFSMSEMALISLSKIRMKTMIEEDVRGAKKVEKLLANQKKLLSTILIGNNLANIGASVTTVSIATDIFGKGGLVLGLAAGILTFLILVFCEIIPKTFAAQNSERVSLAVATPISMLVYVLIPLATLINFITSRILRFIGVDPTRGAPLITESELKTMVNASHEAGVLEIDEREMIHNVFEFGDNHASDVMIPRTDMVAISFDATYSEVKARFEQEQFSRMPVYKENPDNIVGVLYLKDFAFFTGSEDAFKMENSMREAFFTYLSKPTDELFNIMRVKRISLAIVLDEYGGTAGIVTMEDLIEEIVGDIADEYDDVENDIEIIKEDEYIVDGSTKIDDVNNMIGTRLESEDFDSIGGYVIGILGHIPETGETVEHDNIKFIIEELDKNRISKLRIYT